jgi:hypothetical protein
MGADEKLVSGEFLKRFFSPAGILSRRKKCGKWVMHKSWLNNNQIKSALLAYVSPFQSRFTGV